MRYEIRARSPTMTVQRLPILANVNSFTGYGKLVNRLVASMSSLGVFPVVRATQNVEMFGAKTPIETKTRLVHRVQPEDFELIIHPPELAPTPEKFTAYFTMWESTRLKELAVDLLNMSDVVIVPSHWNAATFSAQGVKPPIFVVPLGCDASYTPMPSGKFTFGAAGRMSHGGTRKGIAMVIDCFLAAFDGVDDVRLNVKVFPDCNLDEVTDPRITVTRAFLTESQMTNWIASSHCFVSAARGEGWGLHQHEAMAMGRPVIAPIYGGLAEFMNRHNSYPVAFTHAPDDDDGFYAGYGNLITIDEWDMVRAMREAYENRKECEQKGWVAHRDVRHLTWENSAKELIKVLKQTNIL